MYKLSIQCVAFLHLDISLYFLTGSSLLDCISGALFISIFHHLLPLLSNSVFIFNFALTTCLLFLYTVFSLSISSIPTVVFVEFFLFLRVDKLVKSYFTGIHVVIHACHYEIWEVYCICKCNRSTHIYKLI